jgi:hypothetical protein
MRKRIGDRAVIERVYPTPEPSDRGRHRDVGPVSSWSLVRLPDDVFSARRLRRNAVCQQVRRLVHDADPGVEETIKRSVRPYFVLQGNIRALLAAKDHVNVFIYDPTVADPHGIINRGHGDATARAVQIYRGDAINRPALLAMFRAVIANNRAGGWRRITASPPPSRAAQRATSETPDRRLRAC